MTADERIDALAFQLMRALDKIDVLNEANEELRVKNALYAKQLRFADDAMQSWHERDMLG